MKDEIRNEDLESKWFDRGYECGVDDSEEKITTLTKQVKELREAINNALIADANEGYGLHPDSVQAMEEALQKTEGDIKC